MFTRLAKKSFFGGLLVAVLVEVITFVLHHAVRSLLSL